MKKLWILLAALACLLAGCGTEPEEPTLPPPEDNPYSAEDFEYQGDYLTCLTGESRVGIDVSSHQGAVDWNAVAAGGVEFAMIRVGYRGYGQGEINEDANARTNIEGALTAGLDVGVYFFSQAVSTQEAAREAAWVVSFIEGYDLNMPVVFDWEHVENPNARTAAITDRDLLTACAQTYLEVVEAAGYTPMVYFNNFQAEALLDLRVLRDYDFWLALYDQPMTFPYRIRMWQYTDKGRVDGIEGNVDVNLWFDA